MDAPDEEAVRAALSTVIDPEVGIDIVNLGLIYDVRIDAGGARVTMTMTTPACPLGPHIQEQAETAIRRAWPEAPSVVVEIVWSPPWSPDRMTREARAQLGWPEEG
jgi:metal-sulfur cluster biosynthetic enzyme